MRIHVFVREAGCGNFPLAVQSPVVVKHRPSRGGPSLGAGRPQTCLWPPDESPDLNRVSGGKFRPVPAGLSHPRTGVQALVLNAPHVWDGAGIAWKVLCTAYRSIPGGDGGQTDSETDG